MSVDQPGGHTFQVDLRGLVDLLSHHLYSSPRVYLRELLQNAVDAVTARRATEPDAPAAITLTLDGSGLRVDDPGVGLTEADVHRFLATIGRSSKRDEIEGARREFLGQFGIGLLACFTVAEEIRVVTRSALDPAAPAVEWRAASDGTYAVRPAHRDEPGTTVHLTPRPGAEEWFTTRRVVELARDFGSLLPFPVTVEADGRTVPITDGGAVWDRAYASPAERRAALLAYGARTLGFTPLDVVELDVPLAGVRGAAFVLPTAANPSDTGRHRIYLKGMLLGDAVRGLLPEWAFFVRCVIDTDTLRPTASREGLYEDETLAAVREALGARLRDWLTGLAAQDPARLGRFLAVHSLGVKALARHDTELLAIMLPFLRFETTDGPVTLAEFARRHPVVHVAPSVEEFRQVAAIAAAQGIGVVNGGYTYDQELVARLPDVLPGVQVAELAADVVTAALDAVPAAEELALAPFLAAARAALDPLACDVVLRAFEPASVSALHLDSRDARGERARADLEAESDDLWAEILGALKSSEPRTTLVLNHRSPAVRRLAALTDRALLTAAVEALYAQALLMAGRPLRPADLALVNRAFDALLGWAARTGGSDGEGA
ncbi:HSP90 family protein [Actinocorallia sp. API 0066]|uniref:HSP90 family protein n=1 Tax=Actinocorallia sp. API 0066 TaxID=2896846 RepID=UPI001E2DEC29|nr:HSP90 family protein [Actinocorallia sp. API 0066]MCD0452853.1 HSP90 family protein [Actinocorallia sp. API 0066]